MLQKDEGNPMNEINRLQKGQLQDIIQASEQRIPITIVSKDYSNVVFPKVKLQGCLFSKCLFSGAQIFGKVNSNVQSNSGQTMSYDMERKDRKDAGKSVQGQSLQLKMDRPLDSGDSSGQIVDADKQERVDYCKFIKCQFSRCNFMKADLRHVQFKDCMFYQTVFNGAMLINVDFTGSKFIRNVSFKGVDLSNVKGVDPSDGGVISQNLQGQNPYMGNDSGNGQDGNGKEGDGDSGAGANDDPYSEQNMRKSKAEQEKRKIRQYKQYEKLKEKKQQQREDTTFINPFNKIVNIGFTKTEFGNFVVASDLPDGNDTRNMVMVQVDRIDMDDPWGWRIGVVIYPDDVIAVWKYSQLSRENPSVDLEQFCEKCSDLIQSAKRKISYSRNYGDRMHLKGKYDEQSVKQILGNLGNVAGKIG